MSRPVALVTGGSGVVGPAVLRRLAAAGYRVRSLSRTPPPADMLPSDVEVVLGDLLDREVVEDAVRGAHVVLHLAAMLHRRRVDDEVLRAYRDINIEGTCRVRDAAVRAGVERFVLFSTINVYGPSEGDRILDEDSEPRPQTPYATSKLAAEEIVLEAGDELPAVVLRLAAVYGPRMRGNYAQLARALAGGWFLPIGPGANRRTLVHVEDVATSAVLAAEHPAAVGRIFNVTDGAVHTFESVLEAMCRALNRRPPRRRIPESAARACVGIAGRIPGLGRTARLAEDLLDKILEDVAVSGERIQSELGFRPRFDLWRGWEDVLGRSGRVRADAPQEL